MLRVEVSEAGQGPLPAIDVDDATFVIGSAHDARVRLPAEAAQPAHVTIEDGRYRTHDGESGAIGDGVTLEIGAYRVRIAPAPAGSVASPPQRTESLARELMRGLLGTGGAPTLEVVTGPVVGAIRKLAAPESVLVIGRGDEADWILVDEDLSRAHAEVRRGWDGTRLVDKYSKNGSKIDGVMVAAGGTLLHDGALVELGKVALRYRDPVDRQLAAPAPAAATVAGSQSAAVKQSVEVKAPVVVTAPKKVEPMVARPSAAPFYVALAILIVALAGLVWVLSLG